MLTQKQKTKIIKFCEFFSLCKIDNELKEYFAHNVIPKLSTKSLAKLFNCSNYDVCSEKKFMLGWEWLY